MYANPRGIKSKKESINSIIEEIKPDIIAFAETNLKGKNTTKIKGFKEVVYRNPKHKVGGILLAIKETSKIGMVVLDINQKHEQLWVKIKINSESFILGLAYGIANETVENKEEIEEWHEQLEQEYTKHAEEKVMIIGDLNAHIGNDDEGIEGNLKKKNKNGRLLREFVKRQNLTIINKQDKCTGKWTREDPKGTRTIIDYAICNWEMYENINKMIIDDEHKYKITRYQKKKGKAIETPSDHNTIIIEVNENIISQRIKEKRWNYKNEEGLTRYKNATEKMEISEQWDPGGDINKKYKKWTKQIKTTMYRTIQRVTIEPKKTKSAIKELIKRKQKAIKELNRLKKNGITKGVTVSIIQQHIDNMLQQITKKQEDEKTERLQKRIQNAINKNSIANEIWSIRKGATNRKDPKMAIKTKDGKTKLTEKNQIQERYKEYFQELLENRKIRDEYKELEKLNNEIFKNNMKIRVYEEDAINQQIDPEEMQKTLKILKNDKTPGPDEIANEILKNSGKNLLNNILKMINYFLEKEEIPEELMKINIKTLYKGKGEISDLKNQRGLFLSNSILKLLEKIIQVRIDPKLEKEFSELQAGGREGRSIQEQLFTLRSIMEYQKYKNQTIVIQCMDLKKAFDTMVLVNVMNNMWEAGIRGKIWRIIYEINKKAIIYIKTPFGTTTSLETYENLKQGSVLASKMAAMHTDTVNKIFKNSGLGIMYGKMNIGNLLFQDDIIRIEATAKKMDEANKYLETFEKINKMEFHPDKTVILTTGGKTTNVKLNGNKLKQVGEIEYLGDVITEDGKLDATIENRKQKVVGITAEICAITSELGSKCEIRAIIQYHQGIIVPRTIFNAETWNNETKENIQSIEGILHRSLKRTLKIPYSTPTRGLYRELGLMSAKNQMAIKKIVYLHRILTGKSKLVKEILQEQRALPGKTWISNILQLMNELRLPIEEDQIIKIKKEQWKKMVKTKIWEKENQETTEEIQRGKKCQLIKNKENKIKQYIIYLDKEDAMTILLARLDMIDLKTNYKGMYKDVLCTLCEKEKETLQHITTCSKNEKRTNIDINEMLSSEDLHCLKTAAKIVQETLEARLQKLESSKIPPE